MMFLKSSMAVLLLALVGVGSVSAQTSLTPLRTIRLPSASKGTFGNGFPFVGRDAYVEARLKVLPDQSALVLLPNATGIWELLRIANWWTDEPKIESLATPGWSGANARGGKRVATALLVTADGRYAVTIGSISKGIRDLDHVPAPPARRLSSEADALFTVVDLHEFTIVSQRHLSAMVPESLYGAQVVGEDLLLETNESVSDKPPYDHLYQRAYRLLTLPELGEGPNCTTSHISFELYSLALEARGKALTETNTKSCAAVLQETHLHTAFDLEFMTFLHQEMEPEPVLADAVSAVKYDLPRPLHAGIPTESATRLGFITDEFENNEFRYLSGDESIFGWNPAFQSQNGRWYALNLEGSGALYTYMLDEYSRDGMRLQSKPIEQLFEPSTKASAGCRVSDVSDAAHILLAQCRNWKVDMGGATYASKQWIDLIDTETSEVRGFSVISSDYAQRLALSTAHGRVFVLVLRGGSTLTVYAQPETVSTKTALTR